MDFSISIYKDKKENLLIVPQVFDENGIRRNSSKYQIIEKPYSPDLIGEKVKKCFDTCINEPTINSNSAVNVYELATGIKSFSKFSKDRLLVRGLFNQSSGFTFSPWKRYNDGSYGLDKGEEIDFKASTNATVEEIGELIIKAFDAFANFNISN